MQGKVIGVGAGARDETGKVQPLDVKANDTVLFGKWSGTEVKIDGEEYLIMKDIPEHVWKNWDEGNRPKMVICRKDQLPATREWRNAWRISEELAA